MLLDTDAPMACNFRRLRLSVACTERKDRSAIPFSLVCIMVRSFGQQTTNISNLNIERCLQLAIPMPSLDEQRRIAALLDRADELRAKRRTALTQLDALVESVFVNFF